MKTLKKSLAFLLTAVMVLSLFALAGCDKEKKNDTATLNEKVSLAGMDVTVGNIEFLLGEIDGNTVVLRVPVTLENASGTASLPGYKAYVATGEEAVYYDAYYGDSIHFADPTDLSDKVYLYFGYSNDGEYKIVFNDEAAVTFDVASDLTAETAREMFTATMTGDYSEPETDNGGAEGDAEGKIHVVEPGINGIGEADAYSVYDGDGN